MRHSDAARTSPYDSCEVVHECLEAIRSESMNLTAVNLRMRKGQEGDAGRGVRLPRVSGVEALIRMSDQG